MQPENFTHATLDAIASDGFSDRARHGETQPRTRSGFRASQTKRGEQRCGDADSLVIDGSEVGSA